MPEREREPSPAPPHGAMIGVDIGGTFTDFVARTADGGLLSAKTPTTPAAPAIGLQAGLNALAGDVGQIAALAHGTTIMTNAIIEGRTARVGLITTRGFRDVLEIGRQHRSHLYRLDLPPRPDPLVPRHLRLEISERLLADGSVMQPLCLDELPSIIERFEREGVEAIAVCLLHAYANPSHERALQAALAAHFGSISISSEINAEYREFERTSTTALNAGLLPLAGRYLDDLVARLGFAPGRQRLSLLQSNGGMMSAAAARVRPLAMAMSGPAAGVAAAAALARRQSLPRALSFDMGGTTTDVCLITDGQPSAVAERRLEGRPVRLPSVAVESVGAGGGSIAWVDATGALKVGPRSAGADPGPACYGRGGDAATVSDANLVLGYLETGRAYGGGAIRLDAAKAATAIEPIAARLGLSLQAAALGIVEVANAAMARALQLVSTQRGHDVRGFTLIAYGGAGPLHAGRLARSLRCPRVLVPAFSGAFSALGCLLSEQRYDAVQTRRLRLTEWDAREIERGYLELESRLVAPMLRDGAARAAILLARSLDLRYAGQNYELETPYLDGQPATVRAAFEALHEQRYGYRTGDSIEVVNLRLLARVPADVEQWPRYEPVGVFAKVDEQPAYFAGHGLLPLPRYDRAALPIGAPLTGPALIADADSTVLVYPGQSCQADAFGNLLIEAPS